MIPANALIFRAEGLQVAVVRDDKTDLRTITIGRDYGTEVEVVSGVAQGDEVIENPSDSLISGAEVRVIRNPPESGESGDTQPRACRRRRPADGRLRGGSQLQAAAGLGGAGVQRASSAIVRRIEGMETGAAGG